MWKTSKAPKEIVKAKGMSQITDASAIEKLHRRGFCGERSGRNRLPRWQDQTLWLFRRSGDEGFEGTSQPRDGQSTVAEKLPG